ncbi:MAG: hypothetical protein WEA09_07255 [Gemmatimonadota bacterium]
MNQKRSSRAPKGAPVGSLDGTAGKGWMEEGPPAWGAALLYAFLTILLFREFIFSSEMLFGQDTMGLGYMARAFFAQALQSGAGFPLWNPQILGGTPLLESFAAGDALYPTALLLLFTDTHRALGWKLVIHVFLAGLFMYAWLRTLGGSRWAATLAGAGFLLAPYMVTLVYPGHDGKLFVTALTPLLFLTAERALRSGRLREFSGVGLSVALVCLTPHLQMAYFLFGAVGVYALFRSWETSQEEGKRPALRRWSLFLVASLLGAGAAGVQLLPAAGYITEHSRRTATTVQASPQEALAYSSSWSLHPEEVVSLVVPEFTGNSAGGAEWATDTYWGRNFFKLNHEYLGVVMVLLAMLGAVGRKWGRLPWFMGGLGGLALLFALGAHTPVWRLAYEFLPGVSLFRAPSMAIFLTGFAVATLAGFGVDRLLAPTDGGQSGMRRRNQAPGGVPGGSRILLGGAVCLAVGWVLAASGILLDVWTTVFQAGREENQAEALARAAPFITRGFLVAALLSGGVLLLRWLRTRDLLQAGGVATLLLILVVVDLFRVDAPFIQIQPFAPFAAADANIRFLQGAQAQDPEPFRVFSLLQGGEDVRPGMFGLELAGGHHPNDMARYRELVGKEGGGFPENLLHPNVLAILNVKYLLWPDGQIGSPQGLEAVEQIRYADGEVYASVYPFPTLPRARLVARAEVVAGAAAVERILSTEFDPAGTVILPEHPPVTLSGGEARGTVRWLERGNNRMRLGVESEGSALLVIAENWYPAWVATVNGEEAPVLRANHTLRAVPVPPGSSEVELMFQSGPVRLGLGVTALSLLLLLLPLGGQFFRAKRKE